ncbi:MAG: peptide ABC transporter substrate-binding protein [Parachlamydiales bacterium]
MKRAILLACIATAIIGCQKKESLPVKPKQSLTLAFTGDPRSLDPLVGIDDPSCQILDMIGEGLYRMGPGGKLTPGLATSHTVSPDGLTYTFTLRKSTWSNGDPLTAHDVEASWKRAARPEHALGAYYLAAIENLQDALEGRASADTIGVKALDETTLRVRLKHPLPTFPEMTAMSAYFPVHRNAREGICPNLPITNGPFVLTVNAPHDRIVVKKNARYWDQQSVNLEQIEVVIVPDINTQASLFERGELDWFGAPFTYLPNHMIPALDKRYGIHECASSEVAWIFVNTQAPPFNNAKMRRAFAYATNRGAISSNLLNKLAHPNQALLPRSMALTRTPYFEDGNIVRAQQLFHEALEEMGMSADQLPPITLYSRNCDLKHQINQALQAQWQAAFGIPIELRREEWNVYYERISRGEYQLGAMSWVTSIDDPIWFLQVFDARDIGVNRTRWENTAYSDLLAKSQKVVEMADRQALMQQAEALLMEEMPVIPLFSIRDAYLKREGLEGVFLSNLSQVDFKWARWE